MTTTKTRKISDGIYFLHPDGCGWIAAQFRSGKLIDGTEQCNAGTHAAAGDDWAGVVPCEDDTPVDEAMGLAIIREAMGKDVYADMVVVTLQVA